MRVFVAVELSDAVRQSLLELAKELEKTLRDARWVAPENLHLTLRFLGETSGETAARISESLRSPLAAVEPFPITFGELGVFPDTRRPRVLWVGVPKPPEALFVAQAAVEQAVRAAGLPPEPRAFEPHLTLARFKKPARGLAALLATEPARRELGTVLVSEITCFASQLGARGATYRTLSKISLGPGQGHDRLV